jgi:hypothetical protein
MGDTTLLRQRIAEELAIPADHIIINASHDHSAPRGGPPTPGTSSAQGRPYSTPAYVQQIDDSIVDVLKQAKAALQPARMGFGTGKVDVSVARYGYTPERGWRENPNEDGFSDKTVSVVKFETPSGTPIAIMFNYAVHSNSMTGEPKNMINADICGNAEKSIEHQYNDKVIALWSMGAAADEYPKFNWHMGLLDDKSSPDAPGEIQGAMIGGEVMKKVLAVLLLGWASVETAPTQDSNGAADLLVLNKIKSRADLPGNLAFVDFASGKVVARVPVGREPHEVAASPDGKYTAVTNTGAYENPGNSLSLIDIATRKELRRVDLGPLWSPHGLVWRDGRFYFTGEGSKVIGAYDPVTDHVVWIMGTGQDTTHMLVFSRDGKTIFASNRSSASVSMLELTGDSPIKAGS